MMARTSRLSSMAVEALLELRDEIGTVLSEKAKQLQNELSRLGADVGIGRRGGRASSMKGRKVPAKYRDRSGNTWAGRGAQPRWLREKLKEGAKLEDFSVERAAGSRKASARKTKREKSK